MRTAAVPERGESLGDYRARHCIRDANPPLVNTEKATRLTGLSQRQLTASYALLFIGLLLSLILSGTMTIFLSVGVCIVSASLLFGHGSKTKAEAKANATPIPLHVYNVEYDSVLTDNSTLKTNIFFSLPTAQANLSEQLKRFAEKEILIFTAPLKGPPTAAQIQDHLHQRLLRFQDENLIPVLRVEVSMNIHNKPIQPPPAQGLYV